MRNGLRGLEGGHYPRCHVSRLSGQIDRSANPRHLATLAPIYGQYATRSARTAADGIATLGRHRLLHFGDDLLGGVAEVVGGDDRQAAFGEDVLALLDVGAFQANDQRHLQMDLAGRRDDPFGDDVAAHDAAEDVDQYAFDRRVEQDDLERRGDLLLRRAAADVAEVGGGAAVQLDDVHSRHRQAGAVDHAADVAIQFDVGEVVFRRLDLRRLLFGEVAQLLQIRVAEFGVVVEADLGVEHQQLAVFGHRQRVDLDLA